MCMCLDTSVIILLTIPPVCVNECISTVSMLLTDQIFPALRSSLLQKMALRPPPQLARLTTDQDLLATKSEF